MGNAKVKKAAVGWRTNNLHSMNQSATKLRSQRFFSKNPWYQLLTLSIVGKFLVGEKASKT